MPKYRKRLRGLPKPVRESVAAPPRERVSVTETPTVIEAPRGQRPGRLLIRLIRAGWSLNGVYYPAEVLARDGARAWPRGTQSFIDHPTEGEEQERPVGSIRNLAAVLTEDARWDEREQALMAEVRLFAPWREPITDMAGSIGMSIRAWVFGDNGEVEGREGFIVSEIAAGRSVDFVTKPAAGGAIVSVLESLGNQVPIQEARNVGHWFESRIHSGFTEIADRMFGEGYLTRDERITLSGAVGDALAAFAARIERDAPHLYERDPFHEPDMAMPQATDEARRVGEAPTEQVRMALQNAVRAAYGGEETYVWVRDFDPARAVVWFEISDRNSCRLWQQPYSIAANAQAELSGERVEVVARTVYDPVGDTTAEAAPTPSTPPAAVRPQPVVENVTGGIRPTAPTPPTLEVPSMAGNQNTGVAPGAAGAAESTPAAVPVDVAEANAARVLAERERDEALARAAALTEAQQNAARLAVERDAAIAESRRLRADGMGRDTCARMLAESGVEDQLRALMLPRVTERIVGRVPLTESGEVNTEGLTAAVTAAIEAERTYAAALLEAQGVGNVRGLGTSGGDDELTDEQFDTGMASIFESIGMPKTTAALAAKGR